MKLLETIIYVKYKGFLREIAYPLHDMEIIDGWVYASYILPSHERDEHVLRKVAKQFRDKGFTIKRDQYPKFEKDFTIAVLGV